MQAKHHSSSDDKATTAPGDGMCEARHLMAIRIVGTALFDYQVHKTPDARIRLEAFTTMAHLQGDLTASERTFVSQLLANQ